jgi:hypothetical protein
MNFEEKAQLWYELNCALAVLEKQVEDEGNVVTPMHDSAIQGIRTVLPLVKNIGGTTHHRDYRNLKSSILDKNTFAGYWASLLAEKGITQAEVGYAIGISQQSVSEWKARCRIPTKHFAKIRDLLSLSDEESEKLKGFYFSGRGL